MNDDAEEFYIQSISIEFVRDDFLDSRGRHLAEIFDIG